MPRIAAHRLAVLLFLPACHMWRPVPLAPHPGYQSGRVRRRRGVRWPLQDFPEQLQATMSKQNAGTREGMYVLVVMQPDPTWQKVGQLERE